jgi:tetratricopeptide (TPR) repeat protein
MNEKKPSKVSQKAILISIISVLILIILGLTGYLIFSGTDNKLAKLKQQGNDDLMREDYESAKEEFKKALQLSPGDIVIYFDLAEAYIGMEDYIDAAVYLEQALTVAEDVGPGEAVNTEQYVSLTVKLAECYDKTGEDHKKVELLQHSLKVTESERIKELLSAYYPKPVTADMADGEYEVIDVLQVGLSGSGMIYYTLDGSEPTSGSKVYEEVISLPAGSYEIKAITYNEYGFSSEISTFQYTVTEIDYLNRAIEQVLNKDYDAALKDFEKVISANIKEPKAYYGIAKVYIAKGEYDKAARVVELGLSYGDDKDLQFLLSELVPTVEASLAPGVYASDRLITVELKGYGTDTYYTTDGSLPDRNSPVYREPIPLQKGSNIITASSLSTFGTFGKVVTFEYTVSYQGLKTQQPGTDHSSGSSGKGEEEASTAPEPQANENGEADGSNQSSDSTDSAKDVDKGASTITGNPIEDFTPVEHVDTIIGKQ